jgi:hypothetical protein
MNGVILFIGLVVLIAGIGIAFSNAQKVENVQIYPYAMTGAVVCLMGVITCIVGVAMDNEEGHGTESKKEIPVPETIGGEETETDLLMRILIKKYREKGFLGRGYLSPQQLLKNKISEKVEQGKTREQAIKELYKEESLD